MKDLMYKDLCNASNLDEVFDGILRIFRVFDPDGPSKEFLYISGVINSYGDIDINLAEMARRTEEIRIISDRKVFAPTCVLQKPLAQRLIGMGYRHGDWMAFWTKVICSGYVGGVIMTPGWERSRGADTEFAIARNLGLTIYLYDDVNLSFLQGSGIA